MKEHAIILSNWEARAFAEGRITQLRRPVIPPPDRMPFQVQGEKTGDWFTENPDYPHHGPMMKGRWRCPFGVPGDVIWGRETWRVDGWHEDEGAIDIEYRDKRTRQDIDVDNEDQFETLWIQSSDDAEKAGIEEMYDQYSWASGDSPCRWRSPATMPRWAARTVREVVAVRVERAQAINEEGAYNAGCRTRPCERCAESGFENGEACEDCAGRGWFMCLDEFRREWDARYSAKGYGWDANPWVWVADLKVKP